MLVIQANWHYDAYEAYTGCRKSDLYFWPPTATGYV